MKDLGIKHILSLHIEHLKNGVLLHQVAYTKKILKQLYMDKAHSLSTPVFVITWYQQRPFLPLEYDSNSWPSGMRINVSICYSYMPDIVFSVFCKQDKTFVLLKDIGMQIRFNYLIRQMIIVIFVELYFCGILFIC